MEAVCLNCKKTLPAIANNDSGTYACGCGREISYACGIYQFVELDDFYEGKFTVVRRQKSAFSKLVTSSLRWISIDGNEERMWHKSSKFIKRSAGERRLQILNIGSGGGHDFLNKLGVVTAVDLSMKSLLNARSIYESCYLADARQLPFADESFDLVFSSHLLGHIPLETKQQVIKEIWRVTKQGGFSLHSAECEADNFVYARAKKHPDLYQKYFVDMYGHHGLELPESCKERFRKESFEPVLEISDYCKGIIRPADSYKVFFGSKEFREKDRVFNLLAGISEILSAGKCIRIASGLLLYALTPINRVWGRNGVDSVKLLYRKGWEKLSDDSRNRVV